MQIENALTSNPNILEAAVISVPDKKYGEVVGAWIKPKAGVTLSRESVRKIVWETMNPQVRILVYPRTSCNCLQNAPAWVWFIGEDGTPNEFPNTASGKVQKHILRRWGRELAEKGIGLVK